MKRLHLLGMGLGSAALLASGSVLAAPPSGHAYNDYTVAGGVVTLNSCAPPACVTLLNETGLLQARVREDNDPNGQGYFQTINVEDTATGPALALEFRSESFVSSASGTNSVAALNYVDLSGDGFMQAMINTGTLQGAGDMELAIRQQNILGAYGTGDFSFKNSGSGTEMRVDMNVNNLTGNRGTAMTVRETSGSFTADSGNLELVDGTLVSYSAGDRIRTTWGQGELWNLGPMHATGDEHRIFEIQSVANVTTDTSAAWTNTNDQIDNTGIGFVNFEAVWADAYALNNNLWNSNFGTVPNAAANAGELTNLNAANNPFPDFPDHTP